MWASMLERAGAARVLVGRTEGKSTLGRPGLRWQDAVKMKLQ